jgi:hypothetical protein
MVNNTNKILPTLLLIIGLAFSTLSTLAQASNITVNTSHNPITLDDAFHLIYEADSSVDDDPDFTPIYKNFDVLSSSESTNMRSINGNWTMKKTWNLTVIAKDIGRFTVPAIAFGSDISPAIQITVVNSTSSNSTADNDQASIPAKIFLESSLDKSTGWVQSQFIYTIRLLRTVNITGASLSEPETNDADAIIQRIGEDSHYQTTRNGIRYEVIERCYAFFPQKSGQLKIKPVTFEGRINSSQPRTIFDQFRISGQLKRLRSKAVIATIKAAPASINLQDWLPATQLKLVDEWSSDINELKAGEPVTRTITIIAEGLTSAQLPDLVLSDVKSIKQYPDKAVTEDSANTNGKRNGITGIKQIKVALIPSAAGGYTLPEIKLQWWNTKTNKAETAHIAETVITATGSAITNIMISEPTETLVVTAKTSDPLVAPKAVTQIIVQPYWQRLSFLLAAGWVITLLFLFKKQRASHTTIKQKTKSNAVSLKAAHAAVENSVKNNNAEHSKEALIEWAKIFYADNTISNLSLITTHCSANLSLALKQLNQSLYNPQKPDWDNKALLAAFKDEQSLKTEQQASSTLKPLY